jgi:hypothetical protein
MAFATRRSDRLLLWALAFMFITVYPLGRFSLHDEHYASTLVFWLIWVCVYVASIVVLPIWALVQAVTNKGRVSRSVIISETLLASLWVLIGAWFLFGGPK